MFGSGSPGAPVRPMGVPDPGQASQDSARTAPELDASFTVSVVIPTLNEAANLPLVLPRVASDVFEVILVDGASTDGTVAVAKSLRPEIKVVMEPRRGKGAALCAGFRAAQGDIIVMLDADGSTDPEEIPNFVATLLQGADFAKGSRFLPNGGSSDISRLRALGNWGFVILVRLLFGGAYTDLCYGYNAFWRSVLPVLALDGDGFEIETMMNVRALREGLQVAEVPSFERSRIHGQSNLRAFHDGWRILQTILRERFASRRSAGELGQLQQQSDVPASEAPLLLVPVMEPATAASAMQLSFELPSAFTETQTVMAAADYAPVEHGTPVIDRLRTALQQATDGSMSEISTDEASPAPFPVRTEA